MLALKELSQLLPPRQLERLATTYDLDGQHQVKLSGPVLFLCLLNGLLNHNELTQGLLVTAYEHQTGASVSQSSFSKALARVEPTYFAELFGWLRQRLAPQIPLRGASAVRVRWVDATTVTLSAKLLAWGLRVGTRAPDKALRHLKSVLSLEADGLPNFLHLCSDRSENADCVALGETMRRHSQPGDLWVFDQGCHGRERLLGLHQAQAFFLTPLSQQHVAVTQVLWEAPNPEAPRVPPEEGRAPLVLLRVEQAVFENSPATAPTRKKWAQMPLVLVHGWRYDERKKTWKALTLMTNLPLSADASRVGPYGWAELAEVYRLRWEMEVLFKLLKQHLSYSHVISRCENGIRVMIYMSLIAGLLMIWYQQKTGIDQGWRVVKFWLAENVRQWTERALRASRLVPG